VGASPFRASVPKDAREHQVSVAADGYIPESRTINFDRDVRLELELKPAPIGTHVTPVATETASVGTAGSDLHVVRPKHNIDEKDPY